MRAAEYLIILPVFFFFVLFMPDAATYFATVIKANQVVDYAVEKMSVEGGWSSEVEQDVHNEMRRLNLDPDVWTIRYSEGKVSHPGEVSFGLQHVYRISAFDIFGEKMSEALKEHLVLPISLSKQRVSQVIIR